MGEFDTIVPAARMTPHGNPYMIVWQTCRKRGVGHPSVTGPTGYMFPAENLIFQSYAARVVCNMLWILVHHLQQGTNEPPQLRKETVARVLV